MAATHRRTSLVDKHASFTHWLSLTYVDDNQYFHSLLFRDIHVYLWKTFSIKLHFTKKCS